MAALFSSNVDPDVASTEKVYPRSTSGETPRASGAAGSSDDDLKIFQVYPTNKKSKLDISRYTPDSWYGYGDNTMHVQYIELPTDHPDYVYLVKKIKRSTQDNLQIQEIHRIEDEFLWLQYQLKKEELTKLHGDCKEVSLFHGTSMTNIENIIDNNFDWRKHGENKGHKFGQGVSFTPLASYASHYTAENIHGGNKLILARVLVTKKCVGDQFTKLPPEGYDTTESANGKVVVKYDDHTFYPAYVISYAGKVPSLNTLKKQRQRERAEERRRREDEASLALTRAELDWLLKEMEHLEQIILSNRNSTRRRK